MKINNFPIEFLNLSNLDIVNAHLALGREVRFAVHRRLKLILDNLDEKIISKQIHKIKSIGRILDKESRGEGFKSKAVQSYLTCCTAWAKGATLAEFKHPKLTKIDNVSFIDLALFLQMEQIGCQTGVFRQEDDSIIMWHTEEDEDDNLQRFDKIRIASIKTERSIIHSFIYPDLLPGPAFSWSEEGTFIAVDSIHANANTSIGFFSNMVYWIILFFHDILTPIKILSEFIPIIDAGAITVLTSGRDIRAEKIEFVADKMMITHLGAQPGSFLFQSNIFSSRKSEMKVYENIKPEKQRIFESRERRTKQAIKKLNSKSLYSFYRMMTSKRGGEYAYANRDVKAYFLVNASMEECEIWFGAGMAKRNVLPVILKHFFEVDTRQQFTSADQAP